MWAWPSLCRQSKRCPTKSVGGPGLEGYPRTGQIDPARLVGGTVEVFGAGGIGSGSVTGTIASFVDGQLTLTAPLDGGAPALASIARVTATETQRLLLASSPTGRSHTVAWNVPADLFVSGNVLTRVTPFDADTGNASVSLKTDQVGEGRLVPFAAGPLATGPSPEHVILGDLDGDGFPEIVVASQNGPQVDIYRGGAALLAHLGDPAHNPLPAPVVLPGSDTTNSVAIGDLNNDGRPDLVSADRGNLSGGGSRLDVFLGGAALDAFIGGTTTTIPTRISLVPTSRPSFVTIGDVTGDGFPDLLIADDVDNVIVVFAVTSTMIAFLNDPQNANEPVAVSLPAGDSTRTVTLADADGDGLLDILAGNTGSDDATIYLQSAALTAHLLDPLGAQNPTGAPVPLAATLPGVNRVPQVSAGDLNDDGLPEIVLVGEFSDELSVYVGSAALQAFLRDPTGSPPTPLTIPNPETPKATVIVDVSGDGQPDLVSVQEDSGDITIFRGGDALDAFLAGTGAAPVADRLRIDGKNPVSIAAGDLDLDGQAELAVAVATANATQLFGLKTADVLATASLSPLPTGLSPLDVAVGDVDGDGRQDLIVAEEFGRQLSIYQQLEPGLTLTLAPPLRLGRSPEAIVLGDLTGDGRPELVATSSRDDEVQIFIGGAVLDAFLRDPSTNPAPARIDLPAGNTTDVAIGDFDGDGQNDLLIGSTFSEATVYATTSGLRAHLLDPAGTPAPPAAVFPLNGSARSVLAFDLDADGSANIVVATSFSVDFYTNLFSNVQDFLADPVGVPAPGFPDIGLFADNPRDLAFGDLDGDGFDELVICEESLDQIHIYPGSALIPFLRDPFNAPFSLDDVVILAGGDRPTGVAIHDIDRDGLADLLVTSAGTDELLWFRSTAELRLFLQDQVANPEPLPTRIPVGDNPKGVAIGDVNGDGRADVVVANEGSDDVSVLLAE